MDHILNARVKRLIKDDLIAYAKFFGVFFAIIALISLIFVALLPIIISLDPEVSELTSEITVSAIGFGSFILIMTISGIVTGAELPMNVRRGVARDEYFKATLIAAISISVILTPISFIANRLISLIVSSSLGSGNVVNNLWTDNLLTFVMYVLLFIVCHLLGYFIAMIWQRFGWVVGVVCVIIILGALGIVNLGFGTNRILVIFPVIFTTDITDGYLIDSAVPELLGPILVMISVFLASSSYVLMKSAPIKVK